MAHEAPIDAVSVISAGDNDDAGGSAPMAQVKRSSSHSDSTYSTQDANCLIDARDDEDFVKLSVTLMLCYRKSTPSFLGDFRVVQHPIPITMVSTDMTSRLLGHPMKKRTLYERLIYG